MAKSKWYGAVCYDDGSMMSLICQNWTQMSEFVHGKNAKHKSFSTEDDAIEFVTGLLSEGVEKSVSDKVVSDSKPVDVASAKREKNINIPDGPYSFVDGSYNAETGVYGYGGFLCVDGKRYVLQGRGDDPEMAKMRNVAGEICGSMAAVQKAEMLGVSNLTILYDYNGIEGWVHGLPKADGRFSNTWERTKEGTRYYSEFMNSSDRKVSVTFQKVAAHTGIEGNEMADVLAKNAVGISLTGPQQKLLLNALNQGKRDGLESISGVLDMIEPEYQ